MLEDFEDAALTYTTNVADDLTDIVNLDYFGWVDSTSGLPGDIAYRGRPSGSRLQQFNCSSIASVGPGKEYRPLELQRSGCEFQSRRIKRKRLHRRF